MHIYISTWNYYLIIWKNSRDSLTNKQIMEQNIEKVPPKRRIRLILSKNWFGGGHLGNPNGGHIEIRFMQVYAYIYAHDIVI